MPSRIKTVEAPLREDRAFGKSQRQAPSNVLHCLFRHKVMSAQNLLLQAVDYTAIRYIKLVLAGRLRKEKWPLRWRPAAHNRRQHQQLLGHNLDHALQP